MGNTDDGDDHCFQPFGIGVIDNAEGLCARKRTLGNGDAAIRGGVVTAWVAVPPRL